MSQYEARENMRIRLADNPNPGQGIVLGTSRDGRELVQINWIMGPHEKSRNRVFVEKGGRVTIEPADPSKSVDPNHNYYYDAMAESFHSTFVVSTGVQTGTVLEKMANGHPFMDCLYNFDYERDAPDFTPRITGAWSLVGEGRCVADLSILRKSKLSDGCDRIHYTYPIPSGLGYCLTTYSGDGDPLPAFQGDPFLVSIPQHTIESIAYLYWQLLDVDNRVALAVKYIPRDTGWSRIFLINQRKKVEKEE